MIQDDISEIVSKLIKEHKGGEKFFECLDKEIQKDNIIDELVCQALVDIGADNFSQKKIVVSGKFGVYFLGCYPGFLDKTLFVNGNLRKEEVMDISPFEDLICNQEFIFFDDSYHCGKTYRKIRDAIENHNGKITEVYVVYDGCKKKEVESLYRYYR